MPRWRRTTKDFERGAENFRMNILLVQRNFEFDLAILSRDFLWGIPILWNL